MKKDIRGIIIGGSPSTGSSLLRQILNRHSKIVCAPETHIWCKEKIFQNWAKYKNRYFKKSIFGLTSEGLTHLVGIEKSEIPGYDKKKTEQLIKISPDIYYFFKLFMQEYFGLVEGQIYGEKTPGNAINFKYILDSSDQVVCIHTARNPYDTMASLVARGNSPMAAAAFYLYNCAHALDYKPDSRLMTIKYEKLVKEPAFEISELLEKLNLKFEEQMLNRGKTEDSKVTKLSSWNYDETDKVQKGSVGRFEGLSQNEKNEIRYYAQYLHLSSPRDFKVRCIQDICTYLDYEFVEATHETESNPIKELKKHKRALTRKLNNFDFTNYPFYFE